MMFLKQLVIAAGLAGTIGAAAPAFPHEEPCEPAAPANYVVPGPNPGYVYGDDWRARRWQEYRRHEAWERYRRWRRWHWLREHGYDGYDGYGARW